MENTTHEIKNKQSLDDADYSLYKSLQLNEISLGILDDLNELLGKYEKEPAVIVSELNRVLEHLLVLNIIIRDNTEAARKELDQCRSHSMK